AKTLLEGGKTEVTIYEAWDHWKARGGALGLAAGKRILEHFGLSEELAEVSNSSEGYTWQFHAKGSKLSFVNVPGCIAMRTDLQRVLVDSMPPDVVKLDHKLVDIVEGDHEVLLTFENGVTASADLVVASDGIHSFVRQKIFGEDVPHFTGFRVLYSVSSTPYRPDPSISKTHWLEAEGAGYAILEMTAGRGSTRHDLCVLILRSEEAITDRWDSTMVKERFEQVAQCLDLPVLQAAVRHAELCFDWGVYESPPQKSWISPRQRIVLLGDAAHATAPFLAQGANMAMHDAYCLGQILLKEEISLSKGLQLYEASRKIYCEGVVAKSSRMGEMHTATGLRAAFRNYFLSACVLRNMSTLFRTDPTKHMPWEKHESLLQRLGRSVSSICSEKPWVHW
ncbi:6-hydroxynicotinate 3-monooxygenase (6-HNA monooxygenase), partial [Durusdinium trenchii]